MPGARRTRKGQTGKRPSAQVKKDAGRDASGVDSYDGRANTAAGSKGKEPGGRWSKADYDGPFSVIRTN